MIKTNGQNSRESYVDHKQQVAAISSRAPHDSEATKEALLRAGTELFARYGFDGVRVEAIARKAGVNKALISYHFGGKRKLYLAILSLTFREVAASAEQLVRSPGPAPDLLKAFVRGFHDLVVKRRPSFPALLLREVLSQQRLPQEIVTDLIRLFGVTRQIIERGVREGSLRPVDPVLAHLSLIGSLVFFFATEPARKHEAEAGAFPWPLPSAGDYIRHIEDQMIRGLTVGSPTDKEMHDATK
jgi:TetR/AcrR family transcriptional regulator